MKIVVEGTGFRMIFFEENDNNFWADKCDTAPFEWMKSLADDLKALVETMQRNDYSLEHLTNEEVSSQLMSSVDSLEQLIGDSNNHDDDDIFTVSIHNYCENTKRSDVRMAAWYETIKNSPVRAIECFNRSDENPMCITLGLSAEKERFNTAEQLKQRRAKSGIHSFFLDENLNEEESS